jgi:UDP-N-acetylglucosamine 2-epimerase (non-hydrolysing)
MTRHHWLTPLHGGMRAIPAEGGDHRPGIAVVVGTRPEVIKMAPVVRALRAAGRFDVTVVSTGQQRELLARAFDDVALAPDVALDLMQADQTPTAFVTRCTSALDAHFAGRDTDAVLVQGDTSSAVAGAMAATWRKIPVGHVEAGLRSFSFQEPFPEEFHRRIIGVASQWHFAPTAGARDNLLREGVPARRIFVTGNTIVDAVQQLRDEAPFDSPSLRGLGGGRLALLTVHRRENHGAALQDVARAVRRLLRAVPDLTVVLPVHPNPHVGDTLREALRTETRVLLCEPLGYRDLLRLMARSAVVLSDSGGIQEEAPSLQAPILILRDRTERPEVVEVGAGVLVGTDPDRIVKEALSVLSDAVVQRRMRSAPNPFGDGRASERIADVLASALLDDAGVADATLVM